MGRLKLSVIKWFIQLIRSTALFRPGLIKSIVHDRICSQTWMCIRIREACWNTDSQGWNHGIHVSDMPPGAAGLGPTFRNAAKLTSHYSCPESLKLTRCSPWPISYPLTWPDQAFIRRLSSPQASELWPQAWARTKMQNIEPLTAHPGKRLTTSCLTTSSCCLSAPCSLSWFPLQSSS